MAACDRVARILIVTPEITVVPRGMGPGSHGICARAGGLGDICSAQIHALHERGIDVHLVLPNYRNVFEVNAQPMPGIDIRQRKRELPRNRIHLAQDRSFYYHSKLFLNLNGDNTRIALDFQREVINRIIPEVKPDLIHCFDWMTGLIPAAARRMGIPCLFTLYRLDSPRLLLSSIEERGIDAASFWQECYYERMPVNYEETRDTNPVDLLTSGVFAAQSVITLSETYQQRLTTDGMQQIDAGLRAELNNKLRAGRLHALPPAPDDSFNPATDRSLMRSYGPENHSPGKLFNKLHLQETLNLEMDSTSPVCFWPTRLQGARPGCRLMVDCLAEILERYREQRLQIVFVAEGDLQGQLRTLIDHVQGRRRIAVCDFDARRYRMAYAGSDFVLMPLHLDPCALPCKIGTRYGSLPVAHDAGAIHDCVTHLDPAADRGNGFLFRHLNRQGFFWALDQAMAFYRLPRDDRARQIQRIMSQSVVHSDNRKAVRHLIDQYALALKNRMAVVPVAANQTIDSSIAA